MHRWSTWIAARSSYRLPESSRIAAANSLFVIGPTVIQILSEMVLSNRFNDPLNLHSEMYIVCRW